MLDFILERASYWAIFALMMVGLYITYASSNLIKRMVGLSVFQTSVFLFYITLAKVAGGTAPILYGKDLPKYDSHGSEGGHAAPAVGEAGQVAAYGDGSAAAYGPVEGLYNTYSNPLPHVLILTAIVVGVATLSVGLAIIVRIREAYGTIENDDIRAIDMDVALEEELDDAAQEARA